MKKLLITIFLSLSIVNIYYSQNQEDSTLFYQRIHSQIDLDIAKEYMKENKYQEAIITLNKSIEEYPNVQAYYYRSKIKFELGDYRGSLFDVTVCINHDSTNSKYYIDRGSLLVLFETKESYNQAIKDFTKGIQLNNKDSRTYYSRGLIYSYLGKMNEACWDWSKSGELGYFDAYEKIKKHCK